MSTDTTKIIKGKPNHLLTLDNLEKGWNVLTGILIVKQKLKLKDGGETFLFATTDLNDKPILVVCTKA